jgi:transposase InsO family protein
MDFISDRESLAIEAGQSLRGEDVVRVLNRLKLARGVPKVLFCDNGSEFMDQMMDLWAYRTGVKIDFSRPGKQPTTPFASRSTERSGQSAWTRTPYRKAGTSSSSGGKNTM